MFNSKEKFTSGNNIIVKVNKKNQNIKGSTNNLIFLNEENRKNNNYSKHSSQSKEKKINNLNSAFQSLKTIEDENPNNTSKNYSGSTKYKEFKGKFRVGSNNYIVSAVKGVNANLMLSNTNLNQINKNKNNTSYTKNDDNIKKKVLQKEKEKERERTQSGNKKNNKSIDRRVLTNAQTKICVDDLLSFKKNETKHRGSPHNFQSTFQNNLQKEKEKIIQLDNKNTKSNFLNIKYA
jgi:hypothetical protein